MYNLGMLLCNRGESSGNEQVSREGLKWLRKAKKNGIEEAQEVIDNAWNPDAPQINPALYQREPSIGEKIGNFLDNLFS